MPIRVSSDWLERARSRADELAPAIGPDGKRVHVEAAEAAVMGAMAKRRSRAKVDARVTLRDPSPELRVSVQEAMRAAEKAAWEWFLRRYPVSLGWRCVAVGSELVPVGGARTGRWAHRVEGYVRKTWSRIWWIVDVDATSGAILAIHRDR
jgi:hypothetical protein